MKKFFTLALASLMLLSCSKDSIWNAQEQGQLSVNVEQGASIFVETKAASTDNFNLKIVKNGGKVEYDGKVSAFTSPMTLPTGTYTVFAENITAEEALAGRGKQRLADTKENVTVNANKTTNITLNCVMVNSKVSFAFDETFKSAFEMENTQITESSRSIVWSKNATLESEIAYFEPGTLNYTITTKRAGEDKTYTGQVEMAAKTWHKLTVKASVVNGQLGITVTVDDTVTEDLGDITVDPYLQ
ncbi:MAG: DUF4493 domain-containing protein [Bacteroidales bacterium]|nr:DUF4493 domain-containing protein [Bacteroidales bacterium]